MKRAQKRQILVDHYLDFYSVAVAMLKDDDDAKDAVQEALVRTLVRAGVDDPLRYCMRTVRHLCIDTLRRKKRLHSLDGMELVADVEQEELLDILREKKKNLSRTERALLELHYEEGFTLAEMAAITGMSLSNMKRVIAVAKTKMKEEIEKAI
ncbi:MAG: sigma-70 family RNA polymerase sigma factor [Bacteroidales bacterium]|nr:sigma-70 family RNA polymerase sigma factor [Bacteroidales bacterium]